METTREVLDTASFACRPDHNVITRYDVETLGLKLVSEGYQLDTLIQIIAEARCAGEAYDLLVDFELSERGN